MIFAFKEEHFKEQFAKLPDLLKDMAHEFIKLSNHYGINPVITRIADPVKEESAVHRFFRAIDFRDERIILDRNEEERSIFLYSREIRDCLVTHFNSKYARRDGKPTLLWHKVPGSVSHFHLQVAAELRAYVQIPQITKEIV